MNARKLCYRVSLLSSTIISDDISIFDEIYGWGNIISIANDFSRSIDDLRDTMKSFGSDRLNTVLESIKNGG